MPDSAVIYDDFFCVSLKQSVFTLTSYRLWPLASLINIIGRFLTLPLPPQSQRGLSLARSGFKECTDEMCLMEAQLESKMGTLLFELKGQRSAMV